MLISPISYLQKYSQMVNLYRDPAGDKIFDSYNPAKETKYKTTKEQHSIAMGFSELTDSEKIKLLDTRVRTLEKRVEEKNMEIKQLKSLLKC